jgi:hypothetical protein
VQIDVKHPAIEEVFKDFYDSIWNSTSIAQRQQQIKALALDTWLTMFQEPPV